MKLMKSLHLKDKFLKLPIIQGGMGIGVSRCRLAGAVAKEGGMGVLSTAQIGYDDPDFAKICDGLEAHQLWSRGYILKNLETVKNRF